MSFKNDVVYNFFKYSSKLLTPLENYFIARSEFVLDNYPPIFIIGPPRSGTTVIYQSMINYFNLPYMNNLVEHFYRVPNIGVRISSIMGLYCRQVKYSSRHGKTEGLAGPHEIGNFWYQWFPIRQHYADEHTLSPNSRQQIRQVVNALTYYFSQSLLFKNVMHSVRIKALLTIFPNALFIVSKRDPLFVAQSIYKIRSSLNDETNWWSVMPNEIDYLLNKPLIEQALYQVYYIEKQIRQDLYLREGTNFVEVKYENLEDDPVQEFENVHNLLTNNGISVQLHKQLITPIQVQNGIKIGKEEFEQLKWLTRELFYE